MIYIFYCLSKNRLKSEYFNSLFKQLPPDIQNSLMKFKKWQDIQRSLLGKMLLITGLKSLGLDFYSINQLKFTKFQRPYFDNSIVDFKLDHTHTESQWN